MFDQNRLRRLWNSIRWSIKELEPHRKFRASLVKEYAGSTYYRQNNRTPESVNNAWALAIETINLAIAGGDPQVQLFTDIEEYLPFAADFEAILNSELKKMQFGDTLQEWVLEALFSLGIMKIGRADAHYMDVLPGIQDSRGSTLFANIVDLDCWVHDANATHWDEIDFCGDRYRCCLKAVQENERYDERVRRMVLANRDAMNNSIEEGYPGRLSSGVTQDTEMFEDYVDLWDIFIPRDGVILTLVDNQRDLPPLLVQEWNGPPNYSGPYYILPASRVPGNLMPKTPGHMLKPLHDLINRLWRKLSRQAGKQKSLVIVDDGAEGDGNKIKDAEDCEVVAVGAPERVKVMEFLGPNQANMAFSSLAYDTFNRLAGNLDAMGGLGPQSSTVGQDEMILGTVSRKVGKLQQRVVSETVRLVKDLAFYLWHSDETYSARRPISGTSYVHVATMTPGERDGEFEDYNFDVSPYSISYSAPGERSKSILGLMTTIVMPALPYIQQAGVQVNWQRFIQLLAKENSLPELNNIFETGTNPYVAQGGAPDAPGKPPVSTRNYVRTSRPAASREGNTQTLMQMAAGGGVQDSQASALMKGTGT